jgi:hypothetical protein
MVKPAVAEGAVPDGVTSRMCVARRTAGQATTAWMHSAGNELDLEAEVAGTGAAHHNISPMANITRITAIVVSSSGGTNC